VKRGFERIPIGSGIEERANGHVAADTGKCVKVADFH